MVYEKELDRADLGDIEEKKLKLHFLACFNVERLKSM